MKLLKIFDGLCQELVCEKHQVAMVVVNSFDFTQFCPMCADELFATEQSRAAEIFQQINSCLDAAAFLRLNEFLAAMATKQNLPFSQASPDNLLTAVVVRSLRDECSVDEVVAKIVAAKNADYLFRHF